MPASSPQPPDLLSLSSVLTSSNTSQKKSVMKYIKSQLLPIVDKYVVYLFTFYLLTSVVHGC